MRIYAGVLTPQRTDRHQSTLVPKNFARTVKSRDNGWSWWTRFKKEKFYSISLFLKEENLSHGSNGDRDTVLANILEAIKVIPFARILAFVPLRESCHQKPEICPDIDIDWGDNREEKSWKRNSCPDVGNLPPATCMGPKGLLLHGVAAGQHHSCSWRNNQVSEPFCQIG